MYQHSNGSSTLPRGFRYHEPSTPEPPNEELRQPSPPRQRLKVRRRNFSNIQAPTDHFLASVAAADTPIPTIEVGHVGGEEREDSQMTDRDAIDTAGLTAPQFYDFVNTPSPPKTPLPALSIQTGPMKRPNWTMGTPSPAEDYFRPPSAMSDRSDFSDDSFYSGSRGTRPSDDGSCTSPESEAGDPFVFPVTKGKGKEPVHLAVPRTPLNSNLRSKTRKDAQWIRSENEHLWATYLIYLQDPTVTPFRVGASCIPPEGVCHRVAREARRSWKGPRSSKSGSATPTEGSSYPQWRHSSSSTRTQLRELCRKDNSAVSRHRHLQTRSPTPFTKPYGRRRTPEPCPFDTMDIAVSLVTSTSESMQPDGPLARLCDGPADTLSAGPSMAPYKYKSRSLGKAQGFGMIEDGPRARRLGSPFIGARTYGPSSSKPFDARPTTPPRQVSDSSVPQLKSPLRFKHKKHQSMSVTQKRRAQNDLEDELSPSGAIVRPRILNEQLFGTPFGRRVRTRGFSLGDEALRTHVPGLFQQPSSEQALPTCEPSLLPAPAFPPPPRLRSPFPESGPSNTFPRRLFHDGTVRRNPYATMHQTRRSIESFDFGEGPSLQSRLQQLDDRLKQIHGRGAGKR